MLRRLLVLAVLAGLPGMAGAQDRAATLADIQQQLTVLGTEMQSLRRELATTTSAMGGGVAGASALERLDEMEGELRKLTAKTEELEFRIQKVIEDGTNRIDDLQFRLTELEGGDVGKLPKTPPLGGEVPLAAAPAAKKSTAPQLAVGEQADFDAAKKLAAEGAPADAFAALNQFVDTYPRSPLAAEAQLYRGDALVALGNTSQAGRAYLESYTLAEKKDPAVASQALYKLGTSLKSLGQTREACITLGQVPAHFPGTAAATAADKALQGMICP